ncbi:MAG: DUF5050 domain-containing protein [Clostridia bacterium]|nr:DUF5050 domain-containing protein [Clostridia bacterium]
MKKIILWIVVAVVALGLIGGGIYFFANRGEENPSPSEFDPVVDDANVDAKIEENKQIILTEPHNVEASLILISAYAKKGDITAARGEADRIASLVPTDYRIYDTMLSIYDEKNDYVSAALFIEAIPADFRNEYKDELRKRGHGLFAGYGNTAGNIANYGWVCIQDDAIYYSEKVDGQALYRADLDGKNRVKLSDHPAQDINVVGDTVYFVDSKEYKIYSVKKDGSDHKLLLDIFGQRLFVIGNRLHYVNWGDGCKIYSANLDGTDNKMVINVSADHVSLSGAWLYYQNRDQMEAISKVKIDGTGNEMLNEVNCLFINGAGDNIYYANWGDEGKLYRCKNDMSEVAEPLSDSKVGYINLYGDWVYYVDWIKDQNIYRKHIKNGTLERVSEDMAMGIFVKGDYVYYYNELDNNRLYRMELDGSGRMRVGQ